MTVSLLRIRARSRARGHSLWTEMLLQGPSGTHAEMADPGGCTRRTAEHPISTPRNPETAPLCRLAGPDCCSPGCNFEWSRTSASGEETKQTSITHHTFRNDGGTAENGDPGRSQPPGRWKNSRVSLRSSRF